MSVSSYGSLIINFQKSICLNNQNFICTRTKKTLKMLFLFQKVQIIQKIKILSITKIQVFLKKKDYQNSSVRKIYILSKHERKLINLISLKKLIRKYSNNCLIILSTSKGVLNHKQALVLNQGGILLGLFFI